MAMETEAERQIREKVETAVQEHCEDTSDGGYVVLESVTVYHARSLDTTKELYGIVRDKALPLHHTTGLLDAGATIMADEYAEDND